MDASPLVKERRDLNPHNFERGSRSIARRVGRGPVKGAACARITLGCAWNLVTPSFCLGETFGYPNHLPILDLLAPGAPVSSIPYRSSYLWRTMAAAAEHTAEGDRHTYYISLALWRCSCCCCCSLVDPHAPFWCRLPADAVCDLIGKAEATQNKMVANRAREAATLLGASDERWSYSEHSSRGQRCLQKHVDAVNNRKFRSS